MAVLDDIRDGKGLKPITFNCFTYQNDNCIANSANIMTYQCRGYKHKKTNADRIRSMTDEELTMFLAETSRCSDWCNLYEKCKTKTNCSYSVCLETWNEWLKQESEGE